MLVERFLATSLRGDQAGLAQRSHHQYRGSTGGDPAAVDGEGSSAADHRCQTYFDERRCSAVYVGIDAVRSRERADRYDATFCEVTVIACPTFAPAKSSE